MSDLWLTLAMVGTFMSILLVFVVVDMRSRERNRPVALLQSQLGSTGVGVDLRQQELQSSPLDRLVIPAAKRVGRSIARLTPFDLARRLSDQLVLAGNPTGWDAERVVAMKIVGAVSGLVGGIVLMNLMQVSSSLQIGFVAGLALVGYMMPSRKVYVMAAGRQRMIRKQLPDVMDLLTISVEAGLGFDAALAQVVKNVPGPLAEELARLLQEVQIGVSRAEAFRHLGERTTVTELQGFVLSMVQADTFGVSISSVLRAQSSELRVKRRQRAEEIAQKIPVKLLFPMIFMVLPALFIIILGPGGIQVYKQFFS